MRPANARGIGRSKQERRQVDELNLARKRADPELTPLMLAARFGVSATRVRELLQAAASTRRGSHE